MRPVIFAPGGDYTYEGLQRTNDLERTAQKLGPQDLIFFQAAPEGEIPQSEQLDVGVVCFVPLPK